MLLSIHFNDAVGTAGVAILLLAFFLNLINVIKKESIAYLVMNVAGAALACYASWLINYIPFVVLEATWMLVSLFALIKQLKVK